jgi:Na+-transporting NADH:ubiquinone oxidoreductase subunit NqrE
VHGFGFSYGLQHTLQFAGSHLLTSLLSFNIGIELGQLLVLALCVPLLNILFRHVVAERMGTIILSVIVGHTAWHWMIERFDVLRQFPWPPVTLAGVASGLGWLIAIVAIAAVAWLLYLVMQRPAKPAASQTPESH